MSAHPASLGAGGAIVARIGPNAITRVMEVLRPRLGVPELTALMQAAGLGRYVAAPPEQMVDEVEVMRLHQVLRAKLGMSTAREVSHEAGLRTGDYLLAHRIPRPVQVVLKRLPAGLAARVLLKAITRHAWTFAGSGEFTAAPGQPVVLTIRRNPLCRDTRTREPVCDFYAGTFERLFRVLVHPQAQVVETECEATGSPACKFEIRW